MKSCVLHEDLLGIVDDRLQLISAAFVAGAIAAGAENFPRFVDEEMCDECRERIRKDLTSALLTLETKADLLAWGGYGDAN